MISVDIKSNDLMELEKMDIGDWFLFNGEVFIRLEWVNSSMLRALKVASGTRCDFPSTTQAFYISEDYIHITIKFED